MWMLAVNDTKYFLIYQITNNLSQSITPSDTKSALHDIKIKINPNNINYQFSVHYFIKWYIALLEIEMIIV